MIRKKGSRNTPKKKNTTTKTGDVPVKVDRALKAAYDALLAKIAKASQKEMEDFDARWEAAGRVVDHDPPLYVVGGFKNAAEFYVEVMKEEPRTAARFVRVARFATPREEKDLGISKLDAALAFIEAKLGHKLEHPPLPIALERLRVPAKDGTKLLEHATVPELRAATSKLTKKPRRPKTPAHDALERAFGAVSSLTEIAVHERDGYVSLEHIPLAAWQHFVRAVRAAKLPL